MFQDGGEGVVAEDIRGEHDHRWFRPPRQTRAGGTSTSLPLTASIQAPASRTCSSTLDDELAFMANLRLQVRAVRQRPEPSQAITQHVDVVKEEGRSNLIGEGGQRVL